MCLSVQFTHSLYVGIVLANCLSAGFQVPFTPSTSTDIHRLPGQKQTSSQVVSSLRGERFNVYGTLRTVLYISIHLLYYDVYELLTLIHCVYFDNDADSE